MDNLFCCIYLFCDYRVFFGCLWFFIAKIFTEMFAFTGRTMTHCWYVVFYVGAIFLMPLYHKISEKSDFLAFSLFVVFPQFSSYLIKLTPVHQKAPIITDQIEYFFLLPTVAFGYICSKYKMYDKIHNIMIKYSLFLRVLLYILMITIPFLLN